MVIYSFFRNHAPQSGSRSKCAMTIPFFEKNSKGHSGVMKFHVSAVFGTPNVCLLVEMLQMEGEGKAQLRAEHENCNKSQFIFEVLIVL